MSHAAWRAHFERSARRPLPVVTAEGVPPELHAVLAGSLARFALGESGEGRIAVEINRVSLEGVDDDYRAALGLFVAEEGRHGRILMTAVKALGGEPARHNWTEVLFRRGRRLLGVRTKLVVLLAAEVVSLGAYGGLRDALPPCPLRDALDEIRGDERQHLAFHASIFRVWTRRPLGAALFAAFFGAVASSAIAVVLLDHVGTWRRLQRPLLPLAASFVAALGAAMSAVLGPEVLADTAAA
jgi:hypothetical protein